MKLNSPPQVVSLVVNYLAAFVAWQFENIVVDSTRDSWNKYTGANQFYVEKFLTDANRFLSFPANWFVPKLQSLFNVAVMNYKP